MYFSIIIPVYNRPQEIGELLTSLLEQTYKNFEVLVIEDGSTITCEKQIDHFMGSLNLRYFYIENCGQGFARNYGMEHANGEYFVLFDSDCLIPPQYLEVLNAAITERKLDAHGGPDAAGEDFSFFQKAINYSMTSFLTTGGIRGKLKDLSKYQARGYNMGLSRDAFIATKGFVDPNRAEDIELSMRLKKMGFRLELVPAAFVYHKRKNTWESFLKQSFSFGQNRVNVSRFHADAIKAVHLMPVGFLLGWKMALLLWWTGYGLSLYFFQLYALWLLLVFVDASIQNRSALVGFLSLFTSFGQLSAYGWGLLSEWIKKQIKG